MNLKEYFDSFELRTIQEFVETRRHEDLHLDFKEAPRGMDGDAQRNFAKALSGFANADGGLIVWGVSGRNIDGVDAAEKLTPIQKLAAFLTKLNSFTGQYVSPLVDGVEHRAILEPGELDAGYVVTLIPASDLGPHMAKSGEDRYYKRSGDSFKKLEHYEIADMFGRRPHASLGLHYKAMYHDRRVSVEVGIINSGRGIARFPYLELEVNNPYVVGSIGVELKRIYNGFSTLMIPGFSEQHRAYAVSGEVIVYPNSMVLAARIFTKIREDQDEVIPNLEISYSLCCEGIPMQRGELKLTESELRIAPN